MINSYNILNISKKLIIQKYESYTWVELKVCTKCDDEKQFETKSWIKTIKGLKQKNCMLIIETKNIFNSSKNVYILKHSICPKWFNLVGLIRGIQPSLELK